MTAATAVSTPARPRRPERLTLRQARRVALAAQGLHRPRPTAGPDGPGLRQVTAAVRRLGLLQIDSVNVLARAHLVPLFSRLGPYDVGLLDRLHSRAPRRLVEAWAHEASFVPVETWPLLEWRRRAYRDHAWGSIARVPQQHPRELALVREIVAAQGPVTAGQVHDLLEAAGGAGRPDKVDWGWNWTAAKQVLEYLFFTGEVVAAGRTTAFERRYDLPERVLPPQVLAQPAPSEADAVRELLAIGARAHGVGTLRDLRDYFRLRRGGTVALARRGAAELVEDGVLVPVDVEGLRGPWYLHRDAAVPRRAEAAALLSPFDPLVFERTRLEELFGTTYRIEIYVPAAQRVHGYYVLPFLEGERVTARVDLKADRQAAAGAGVLRVQSAHAEPHLDAGDRPRTAARLAAELLLVARWLGLGDVTVAPAGDLAPELTTVLAAALRRA
ncbi:winged helix-turn-helix domain-containing protein [Xylanimonas oleitrophica]|uniref:Winged helix-turn-helix domain-containing protein n=1 Tax=Xylanimonas oleitrophica TaxID=2607479 RepID=A0A2W5WTG6_9MICO|nr:crosslink repair DNA glycosylase YcaQ family protein [Xylanimonas oleitrophica]PZR51536.1 winged helix-turn-helix domain-containing protein [Xylanimonas oleitrophica]